ncbi:hypothetical protein [Ensifer canadensis]
MHFSPQTALGVPKLLWAVLRYYYGGAYAAAISAALVLALVSNRSRRSAWLVAFFVGLQVGAIFTLLFDYADDTTSSKALLLPFGGLVGALSAAICTAIWFPDRRDLWAQSAEQAASMQALMRAFGLPALPHRPSRRSRTRFSPPLRTCSASRAQGDLDSAMQVGAIETWLLNYRVWAVVALLTMLLHHFLTSRAAGPSPRHPLAFSLSRRRRDGA